MKPIKWNDIGISPSEKTIEMAKLLALRLIAEQLLDNSRMLERIVLPIPFVPVERPEILRNPKLHRALVLVREILDTPARTLEVAASPLSVKAAGLTPAADRLRDVLFQIEALLSTELGNPIWEGRRS